jgi:hypothetical protein
MFDTLEMIYVFFTSSTKRCMVSRQEVKYKDIEGALQLKNLSVTRRVAHSESIVARWASFYGIIVALDEEAKSEDAKTRVKAESNCSCQMFRINPGLNVHEKCYV